MRIAIYAALLFATPAAAQSVESPNPRSCQVTIARAPEDVRAVVEAWVRSEAQCSVALEVRIVTTEGGLYLLAQDERGRIRERIVPDAQTAGVLIASWIADDNAPLPPPPVIAPIDEPRALAPVVAPKSEPAIRNESIAPPGLAPIAIAETQPVRRSKWLTAGTLLPMSPGSGFGLRAEADALRSGRWYFGGALSIAVSEGDLWSASGHGTITTRDIKAIAYVARPWMWGRWQLRPGLGVGVLASDGIAYDGYAMSYEVSGADPTAEASLTVSRDLGRSWAVYCGPIATVVAQTFHAYSATEPYEMSISRGTLDLSLFAGVRHRL